MQYSEKKFSIESGMEKGRELPQWYLDEPSISVEDSFYLKAFIILGTSRINGMTVNHIPWDKILDYGLKFGLDSENIDSFLGIIMEMDRAFLKEISKKTASK